mmetsp:Transcript_7748/g.13999  ORF Transcript_7748/g.13999 Transcript_7748/m.13999 type:complete len:117 (-) Transcript_7748:1210-1560(-)
MGHLVSLFLVSCPAQSFSTSSYSFSAAAMASFTTYICPVTIDSTAFCCNKNLEATGAIGGITNASDCIAAPTAAGALDQRGILGSCEAVGLDELHSEVAEEVNTSCQSIAVNAHEI